MPEPITPESEMLARLLDVLDKDAFDVRESGMYVDGVIEVRHVREAIDGLTQRQRAEHNQRIRALHDDFQWDVEAERLACSACGTPDGQTCPDVAALND